MIYFVCKCILIIYCVPSTVFVTLETTVKRRDKFAWVIHSQVGKTEIKTVGGALMGEVHETK